MFSVSSSDLSLADAEGEANYLEYKRNGSASRREAEIWWNNLVSLEVDQARGEKLDACGEGIVTKRCSDDEGHKEKTYKMMCKDDLCPHCAGKRHKDRVMAAWHTIERVRGKWWNMTFTIPSEMWWLLKREDQDMKVVAQAVREVVSEMFGGKVGGFYVRHRFSSLRPWEEQYHIHVLVSFKYITSKGAVREFKWFEKEQIRELRLLFVKWVQKLLGWDMGGCQTPDGLPVVHVQYHSREKVRWHTLKYLLRNPVMFDKIGWDGEHIWYDTGTEELDQILVSPKRFSGVFRFYFKGVPTLVWFGWFGNNCRKRYAFVGVRQRDKVKHVDHCEECGCVMFTYEIRGESFYWCVDDV